MSCEIPSAVLHDRGSGEALWQVLGFGGERYPPGRHYWWDNRDRQPRDGVVLQYSAEGQMVWRTPAGDTPVTAGQLLIFAYGEDSAYGRLDEQQTYACRWLTLRGAGLAEHYASLRERYGSILTLGDSHPIVHLLEDIQALARPMAATAPTVMAAAVHRLTMALFEQAESRRQQHQSAVEQAIDRLLTQPFYPWNIKELTARYGCSREHFSRVFAQRQGQSPQRYLAMVRVRQALHLLSETSLSLAQVADQVGFLNAAALNRQVLQTTGRSASSIRHPR